VANSRRCAAPIPLVFLRDPGLDPCPSSAFCIALTNSSRLYAQADSGRENGRESDRGARYREREARRNKVRCYTRAKDFRCMLQRVPAGMPICMQMQSYACKCACTHVHAHESTHACAHARMRMHRHACTCTCTHAHAHASYVLGARAHTHTYTKSTQARTQARIQRAHAHSSVCTLAHS